jgi:tRNA(adenine34) deaminase
MAVASAPPRSLSNVSTTDPFDNLEESSPNLSGPGHPDDERFMALAFEEAQRAAGRDEVPIGCVIVREGVVLGRAHNLTRTHTDPTCHAEMLAISQAARCLGVMRLVGATVYTTVEPCFMCAGALVHARVKRVVWAVRDPKFGGCASLGTVLSHPQANHQVEWHEGPMADASREILQTFFRSKRVVPRVPPGDA